MFLKLDWGIIWPIVNIVVFYLLLRKFLFGPVSEVMEKRKKMISSDLDDAAQTKAEAEEIKQEYEKNLAQAKDEAGQIVSDARARAKNEYQNKMDQTKEEIALMKENARKDIEAEKVIIEEDMKKDYLLYSHFVDEMLRENKYHILELTKIAKNGGDTYQYIQVRNSGGDTFPIGVGAGGSVQGIGVFRMNKEMSFYSKQTEYHAKFAKLSGIMQFPIISKESIKAILNEEEYKYFCEKMKNYEEEKLVIEKENSFNFTKDGVFWGNNLSIDIIGYILDKVFNK